MTEQQRVVVTGMGVVSSVGIGLDAFWGSLVAGKSGLGPVTAFDASAMKTRIAGEIKGLDMDPYLPPKEQRRLDKFCHYAIVAADEAVAMAGLKADGVNPERVACYVGSGVGGIQTLQDQAQVLFQKGPNRNSPLMVPMMIIDMAAGFLSIRYGFKGPNMGIVTACASGAHAIGESYWLLRRGDADAVVTGGTEACITPLAMSGFSSMKALSERNDDPVRASRPFDRERDGFVMSEGAGILVLETLAHARKRGAPILAEIVGYGATGDAYHITAPDPEGGGAARAIRIALQRAGVAPDAVDYINAHGTSTPLNDKLETVAFKKALGEHARRVAISSTKSMTGHALGAAGGLESVVCIQTLRTAVIPPTINLDQPDPDCDLDYTPHTARERTVQYALNTNLGFGGHNSALLFKKWD
ncbi:MAG: beta-ketoacyl-ACP synthase II [Lentisphaeria bacterium]